MDSFYIVFLKTVEVTTTQRRNISLMRLFIWEEMSAISIVGSTLLPSKFLWMEMASPLESNYNNTTKINKVAS